MDSLHCLSIYLNCRSGNVDYLIAIWIIRLSTYTVYRDYLYDHIDCLSSYIDSPSYFRDCLYSYLDYPPLRFVSLGKSFLNYSRERFTISKCENYASAIYSFFCYCILSFCIRYWVLKLNWHPSTRPPTHKKSNFSAKADTNFLTHFTAKGGPSLFERSTLSMWSAY